LIELSQEEFRTILETVETISLSDLPDRVRKALQKVGKTSIQQPD
jgi:hypothetical protein